MDEYKELVSKCLLGEIDEGENIEFKSHFCHPNPDKYKKLNRVVRILV